MSVRVCWAGFNGGSIVISTAGGALYFGAMASDGTWRIIPDGTNLSRQRREAGTYVEKVADLP